MQNIMETASIQRLRKLLHARYGKELELNFLVDTHSNFFNLEDFSVSSGDLYIPISYKESFLAMAKVPAVSGLPSSSVMAICEVVKLILEPALYRKLIETKLQIAEAQTSITNKSRSAQTVLLISQNPHLISKASIVLHETSERWALLQYGDLGSKLTSAQDLKGLGKASIFIPDLFVLSPEDISIIVDFLDNSDAEIHPRLVIGSSRTWSDLLAEGSLDPRLQDYLTPYVADLDRWSPDRKTMTETFNLLLQSSAQSNEIHI